MTKRELSQLGDIGREIKQNEQRLSRLDVLKSDLRAWNAAPGDGAFEMLCLEKQPVRLQVGALQPPTAVFAGV